MTTTRLGEVIRRRDGVLTRELLRRVPSALRTHTTEDRLARQL